jgi:hypothetical protein
MLAVADRVVHRHRLAPDEHAVRPVHWVSPFSHGRGSSWHSWDSRFLLGIFCNVDILLAAALASLLWRLMRKKTAVVALLSCMLPIIILQRCFSIGALETFVGRPWIYLIMTW